MNSITFARSGRRLSPSDDEPIPVGDTHRLDVDAGELRNPDGTQSDASTSLHDRAMIRAGRERGVDYFCYLANIKRLGVVRAHYLWTTINN